MSLKVRSAVLGRLVISDLDVHDLLTCPAGVTYIVKDWRVLNQSAAATSITVWVQSSDNVVVYLQNGTVAANASESGGGTVVMQPGDLLRAAAGATPCHVWVSGTRLDGVAIFP